MAQLNRGYVGKCPLTGRCGHCFLRSLLTMDGSNGHVRIDLAVWTQSDRGHYDHGTCSDRAPSHNGPGNPPRRGMKVRYLRLWGSYFWCSQENYISAIHAACQVFHYRGMLRPTQRPFGKGAEKVYRRMLNEGLLCPIEPLPQQIMNRFHNAIVYRLRLYCPPGTSAFPSENA